MQGLGRVISDREKGAQLYENANRIDIDGITQKMLLEQLKELIDFGFVQKKSFEGYPLHVEYSLTSDMGERILEALRIMQHIGIDYLKANGMEHILEEKGVVPD